MRVDRRRRDVGVSEQQLHDAQVGAVIEQMRRERVPQHVRRQCGRRDARANRVALDQRPECLARERRMTLRQEHFVALAGAGERRPHVAQISLHPCDGFVAHRHEPLLVALADDADHAGVLRNL